MKSFLTEDLIANPQYSRHIGHPKNQIRVRILNQCVQKHITEFENAFYSDDNFAYFCVVLEGYFLLAMCSKYTWSQPNQSNFPSTFLRGGIPPIEISIAKYVGGDKKFDYGSSECFNSHCHVDSGTYFSLLQVTNSPGNISGSHTPHPEEFFEALAKVEGLGHVRDSFLALEDPDHQYLDRKTALHLCTQIMVENLGGQKTLPQQSQTFELALIG